MDSRRGYEHRPSLSKDFYHHTHLTHIFIMSLIEGDAYFPLFSTGELPIDFSAAGLVPDSPGKFPQFTARRASFALSNSQTVPANINLQNLGPLDEPLFSLFMNGPEKMDLASGFVKGLQIPEELLLQSSMVPEARKPAEAMGMGMDGRQLYLYERNSVRVIAVLHAYMFLMNDSVQMGLMPDPMVNGDFNAMVPQMSAKPTQKYVLLSLARSDQTSRTTPYPFSHNNHAITISHTIILVLRTTLKAQMPGRGSLFKTQLNVILREFPALMVHHSHQKKREI